MPLEPQYAPGSLAEIVRRHRADAMMASAKLICSFPDCEERHAAARREVYMVLYEFALERLTREERERILDLLHPCCPDAFDSSPSPPPPEMHRFE